MLEEIIVAQKEGDVFRRWFKDDFFELILWYNMTNYSVRGFQLCYDIRRDEHSLTWIVGDGFVHSRVDEGNVPMRHPSSPTLMEDGLFPAKPVMERFIASCAGIDRAITRLVISKINEYGKLNVHLEEVFQSLDNRRIVTKSTDSGPAPDMAIPDEALGIPEGGGSGAMVPGGEVAFHEAAETYTEAPAGPERRPGQEQVVPGILGSLFRGLKKRLAARAPFMESSESGRERENADELLKKSRNLAKKLSKKR